MKKKFIKSLQFIILIFFLSCVLSQITLYIFIILIFNFIRMIGATIKKRAGPESVAHIPFTFNQIEFETMCENYGNTDSIEKNIKSN